MTATTDAIQARFQAAVTTGSIDPETLCDIRDDARLGNAERVAIYARAYRLRLIECLRAEYPLLARLAGPTAFELFAAGYVAATPSRSFTLYDYGAGFAAYLDAARTGRGSGDDSFDAVPAALARVERAKAEVARARGIEHRAAPTHREPALLTMVGMQSPERFRRPDSVQLLALPFDFAPLLRAPPDAPLPFPAAAPSYLAVARHHYKVTCHPLDADQYRWLMHVPAADDCDACEPSGATTPATVGLPFAQAIGLIVPA